MGDVDPKTAAVVTEEQHFVLLRSPPGKAQKLIALAIVLALLLALLLTIGPLSTLRPVPVYGFVPAYATAMFVNDLITALLLFAQFSILRSLGFLVIASGYLFAALIVVPWCLTFPGVFAPTGLLGAGLQSTNSLFILWHTIFTSFVIAYALLKEADPEKLRKGSAAKAILASVAMTAALVCAITFLVTSNDASLPHMMTDNLTIGRLWPTTIIPVFGGGMTTLVVLGLILLWFRRRSALDLWLMVVLCAYFGELILSKIPVPARFSVGWYAGRACSLLASGIVLSVLLYEITIQYTRLLRAVRAQRLEREARLVTGDAIAAMISHEIMQPLAAIITRSETGTRWLERSTPDIDKARAQFQQITADSQRAGAVIENIRANFRKGDRVSSLIDVNDFIAKTLDLVREELERGRILIKAELNARLPRVLGDESQIQQVLLNLITNAADAMKSIYGPRILTVNAAIHETSGVVISVADTGTGVSPQDVERIFDPMFTTKSDGMGMGLSICRSIIEGHGGRLSVVKNEPQGTVFEFMLHVDTERSAGV